MKEYEDIVVNEYLKPCPHCGFEKPHARKYTGETTFLISMLFSVITEMAVVVLKADTTIH